MTLESKLVLCRFCVVPSVVALAAAAVSHWPYFVYELLRLLVFVAALFLVALWNDTGHEKLCWAAGICGFIFNPIAPFHLNRSAWQALNVAAAVLFAVSILPPLSRKTKKKQIKELHSEIRDLEYCLSEYKGLGKKGIESKYRRESLQMDIALRQKWLEESGGTVRLTILTAEQESNTVLKQREELKAKKALLTA